MAKISTTHYLNKRLKSVNGKYPIYVRVVFNRQNTNFPSEVVTLEYVDEKTFNSDIKLQNEIAYEKALISSIINFIIDNGIENFNTKYIVQSLRIWKHSLVDVFYAEKIDLDYLKLCIINHLKSKSNIGVEILEKIVNIVSLEIADLDDLGKTIEIDRLQLALIKLANKLTKFELNYFGPNLSVYGANKILNYYEWNEGDFRAKFIDDQLTGKYLGEIANDEIIKILAETFKTYFLKEIKRILNH